MVLGKLNSYMLKNEIRTLPNTIHKDKLKMDGRPKPKTRNYKLLEGNIGRTLDDINQSKILYDPPPTVTEIKTKVNKWDLIKPFGQQINSKQGEKTTLRMGENNSK